MWISRAGAVSAVVLAFEAFVLVAIVGAVLYFCIRWTHQARRGVRSIGRVSREYSARIVLKTEALARGAVSPVVGAEATLVGARALLRGLIGGGHGSKEAHDEP